MALTESELRVLRYAALGFSVKETALMTWRSYHTIHQQRQAIYRKLGANGVANAVAIGFRTGILTTEILEKD